MYATTRKIRRRAEKMGKVRKRPKLKPEAASYFTKKRTTCRADYL